MRNDVKLGFAIGGVLLAVVIVFALVNSGQPAPTEQVATGTDQPAPVTPPVDTARSTTPTTPTAGNSTAPSTVTPPSGTSSTPSGTDVFAERTPTPPPAESATGNSWERAFATGEVRNNTPPALMSHQPTTPGGSAASSNNNTIGSTPPGNSGATPVSPSGPVRTPADNASQTGNAASSNTRAALDGGVSERSASSAKVSLPPSRIQPDSDDRLKGYSAGKTGTSDTAAGASISTPAKTVLTAKTHTIKSGETFSTIATSYYGNIRHARLIAKANPGVDSSRLKIGQVINLPAYDGAAEAAATAKANTPAVIDGTRQYRVASGDSLHSIAVKLYGDPRKVDAIYEANKSTIGPDRAKLKLGMVLTLPAQPAVAKK